MLMPNIAAQTPMACASSRGSSKTLRTIDNATGLSIEPPMACSTRAPISASRLDASAQSAEPHVNTTRPTRNTRLRPNRSAIDPDSISRLARTSV